MRVGKFAEAGIDTVNRLVALSRIGNNFSGSIDPGFAGIVDAHWYVTTVDSTQICDARPAWNQS